MIREDLSNKLIHLIRGDDIDNAFIKLFNILEKKYLLGGNGHIQGRHRCVCFTETPINKLATVLADRTHSNIRYFPLGIIVDKEWAYKKGGRPVIYQPKSDYTKLHNDHAHRHVTYDPCRKPKAIDFTWEREWRIKTLRLDISPKTTSIIVPNRIWRDVLIESHTNKIIADINNGAPFSIIEPYPWHIVVLEDLGFTIPDGI